MHHSHKFFLARTVFKPVADSKEGGRGAAAPTGLRIFFNKSPFSV